MKIFPYNILNYNISCSFNFIECSLSVEHTFLTKQFCISICTVSNA